MIKDLIYDIGMNNGDDTAYYLYKGYHVVAIEADPILVKQAKKRFANEIANNKLVILNVGVCDKYGTKKFYVNNSKNEWSSFNFEFAKKTKSKHDVIDITEIDVECVKMKEIYEEYGIPFYLKTDIEGCDIFCLEDLNMNDLPEYVSVEAHSLKLLCVLSSLGYNSFKIIDQSNHNSPKTLDNEKIFCSVIRSVKNKLFLMVYTFVSRFPKIRSFLKSKIKKNINQSKNLDKWEFSPGSSGPFGEDTFGEWCNLEDVAYDFLHYYFKQKHRGKINIYGWFDFHARKGENNPM